MTYKSYNVITVKNRTTYKEAQKRQEEGNEKRKPKADDAGDEPAEDCAACL